MMTQIWLLTFFLFCSINLFSQQQTKELLSEAGRQAYFNKDLVLLKNYTTQINSLYTKTKDSTLLARYYHFKALEHKLSYTNDSAFYYYHKSKNISKLLKDSLEVGRRLLSLALLQRGSKDFLGSEISSIEALQYLEPINAVKYIERTYNNLGFVSQELNKNQDAIEYYSKALIINKQTKDESLYLMIINNLGLLYQNKNDHLKALSYFKQGLAYKNIQKKHPRNYAFLLENLAYSSNKVGKKDSVIEYYTNVLNIRKELNEIDELSTSHVNISVYYKNEDNIEKGKFHAIKALNYAKQSHNNKRWLQALKLLSDLTKGDEAKLYLQEYIQLSDSLLQKERRLKNQFAKIRYDTDKKEQENVELRSENEKKLATIKYHKQQQTIGWLLSAIGFLAFGGTVFLFFIKRKQLIFKSKLQRIEAREEDRQQIAKSLHDEVAGDLRLLHRKLTMSNLNEEAQKLDNIKDNVRNLSHRLSSISFKKVSFKDQIINLITDYFEPDFKIIANGLNDYDWQSVKGGIKRLMYLSIRETIQNSQNHGKATKVTIDFTIQKKNVFLTINDNGLGFDMQAFKKKKGIGLHNLQERVEDVEGTLDVKSALGEGTKISIQIPLNAR